MLSGHLLFDHIAKQKINPSATICFMLRRKLYNSLTIKLSNQRQGIKFLLEKWEIILFPQVYKPNTLVTGVFVHAVALVRSHNDQ